MDKVYTSFSSFLESASILKMYPFEVHPCANSVMAMELIWVTGFPSSKISFFPDIKECFIITSWSPSPGLVHPNTQRIFFFDAINGK